MEGTVSADESGVTVEQLQGVEHAVEWLRGFAQQVRQMADAENGKTALVFVQEDGIPVVPFGMPMQFFKHEKEEIRHVIVILAASDAAARDFDRLQRACIAKDACDCGPFHLSVPAWRQPHAAIGFLLMQHDRKELMPLLEDLRSVGEKAYEAFQEALKEAITCVAMASRKKKRETVDRFIATARSASCEVDSVAPVRPKVNGPVPPSEPPPPWLAKRKPEPKAMPVQPQEKLKADPNKASRAVRWERLSDRPVLPTAKSAPSRRATPPLTLFQVLERPGPVQTESRVQVPQANGQNGWAHGARYIRPKVMTLVSVTLRLPHVTAHSAGRTLTSEHSGGSSFGVWDIVNRSEVDRNCEQVSKTPALRPTVLALRHPRHSPILPGARKNNDTFSVKSQYSRSKHLPPDALRYFLAAIPSALEENEGSTKEHRRNRLTCREEQNGIERVRVTDVEHSPSHPYEGDHCAWMDTSAAKSKQEQLKPRLPNFLAQLVAAGTEPRQKGPHLEMAASCHVYGLRDARSRCNHCGWLNSVWDAIGSSIQGNTRNEGHSCISCNKCQAVHEPTLTLRKRLPRAVIDRSHSELSISTVGDLSTQIHLLNLKVCLDRITSRQLDELTEEKLLEEDPEVYWCLHLFYGLRAEVFWRKGSDAPVLLASTGFHSMCRSLAAAKKQEISKFANLEDFPCFRKPLGVYNKPVSAKAWAADRLAREKGRVQIFNSTRPNGLDGWTMDLKQYNLMRTHILNWIKKKSGTDGSVALQDVVNSAQERYQSHALFPKGRLTNYVRYTKVDLEARQEIERLPGSGSQRIRLRSTKS
ncbi:DENN domain-containing protein 4C [Durusdinium trenchii]|uniref:DENN domain-containing protein 4C n=1 Tax=Durusdinium trenchii TaxID=1381693 RepID=A0ABP0L5M8_9DINO